MGLTDKIKQMFPTKGDLEQDYKACIQWLADRRRDRENQQEHERHILNAVSDIDDDDYDPMADDIWEMTVFIDKDLFHQAMMVVLREAARIAGGMNNIAINVERYCDSAMIFISGGDDCEKIAEIFYSGLRSSNEDNKCQEMAVALEILQHYGGDIGIGSSGGIHGRLYVEIPLCREEA